MRLYIIIKLNSEKNMKLYTLLSAISLSLVMHVSCYANAGADPDAMQEDPGHVNGWNSFANSLYTLHLSQLERHTFTTRSRLGGYSNTPDFYEEITYLDANNRVLSRIQWERKTNKIHVIEVYIYNKAGKLVRDYLAAYLPDFRNAPIQTLVNFHYQNDELHSFRQFDASGALIYEQCEGTFFDEPVFMSFEEDDFYASSEVASKIFESETYLSCFEHTAVDIGIYSEPLNEMRTSQTNIPQLQQLSSQILKNRNPAPYLLKRADLYFELHEFDSAIQDYSKALELDDSLDEAYFGRGMALGRQGKVAQGIQDISVYIERNPTSSLAYTKRGVRYIWLGDLKNAESDLLNAIKLNPNNAEAHDDLGVVYATDKKYIKAIYHFKRVIALDARYQKGYHNLAMVYQITGEQQLALKTINAALTLSPSDKESLLLKSAILDDAGRHLEAQSILQQANLLPNGNWSESF